MRATFLLAILVLVAGCSGSSETSNAPASGGTGGASTGGSGGQQTGGSSTGGSSTGGSSTGGSSTGGSSTGGSSTGGSSTGGSSTGGSGGVVIDASSDAVEDTNPADVLNDVDKITAFVLKMNGIWLVGWSGGMNHFSWVRIRSSSPGSWLGTIDVLDGAGLFGNAPIWDCSGQGTFMIPAKPYSILFSFPASCPSGLEQEYTFDPFTTPSGYPKGAILQATVTPLSGNPAMNGYKFPDSQCNANMTSCTDPLQ